MGGNLRIDCGGGFRKEHMQKASFLSTGFVPKNDLTNAAICRTVVVYRSSKRLTQSRHCTGLWWRSEDGGFGYSDGYVLPSLRMVQVNWYIHRRCQLPHQ